MDRVPAEDSRRGLETCAPATPPITPPSLDPSGSGSLEKKLEKKSFFARTKCKPFDRVSSRNYRGDRTIKLKENYAQLSEFMQRREDRSDVSTMPVIPGLDFPAILQPTSKIFSSIYVHILRVIYS